MSSNRLETFFTRTGWLPLFLGLATIPACDAPEPGVGASEPTNGLSIQVAPLTLPGIGNVCYDLKVTNAAGGGGSVVWAAGDPAVDADADAICSSSYGNGAGGGVTFVGSCDASPASIGATGRTNSVTLWIDQLEDTGGNPVAPGGDNGWQDPCPSGCTLDVTCLENQDTAVVFNISILRQANQGFFDIGVNFEDIFCSAKVDCIDASGKPLDLLFHNGQRDTTVVSALACTAGPGSNIRTVLYREPLSISCPGRPTVTVPASIVDGNGFTGSNPDPAPADALWQYGVYTGEEALACGGSPCNKIYWNIALGLDETIDDCTLTTRMTASPSGHFSGLVTPPGTTYPYIDVSVQLTDAAGLKCSTHPLNGGDGGVLTRYTSVNTAQFYAAVYSGPDECIGSPCLNGGTCIDGINAFSCSCAPGYSGTTCATNINECSPNPCQNGGTCTDGINSFTCTCATGYSGSTCATNINDCPVNACLNGGSCIDGVNSYTCSCAAGYSGTNCSTAITTKLADGAGGGVFNYIQTSGSYNGGVWGGSLIFAGNGALAQYTDCCNSGINLSSGVTSDFGSDSYIAWGRWSSGTLGSATPLRTLTYATNIDALRPTVGSLSKTFSSFAATAPIIVNASGTVVRTGVSNTVTGSVTVNIGNLQSSTGTGTATYQLNIPVGDVTFTISGSAGQYSKYALLGSTSTINGTGSSCSGSACTGIIPWANAAMAFITGPSGQRLGLNYAFSSNLGRVTGAVVFN